VSELPADLAGLEAAARECAEPFAWEYLAQEAATTSRSAPNHGGRIVDGVAATADVLPSIVAAVGDRADLHPVARARVVRARMLQTWRAWSSV
jgi:hypothetical protein